MLESLFNKVAPCEIYETFKSTYFEECLRATASKFLFREKLHLPIKILGFMILQIRSKRQKQPSEVLLQN